MIKTPFFSIIIPTYNRIDFLTIAIPSVINQTFSDWELVVVDDGSRDKTKEYIDSLNNPQIKYIYQKNSGVSTARNTGIAAAKGKWICFLDSDDRFRSDKLQITYKYIQKYPDYQIFHSEEIWYRNGKLLSQKKHHKKTRGFVFEEAVKICFISISTVAIKQEIFKKIGVFDETFPACEDYEFWLRATAKYPIYLIPEYLTIKEGGHACQQSQKYPAMDKFRIDALIKILKSKTLTQEQAQTALTELKQKWKIYLTGARKRGKNEEINFYEKELLHLNNLSANPNL